MKRKMYRFVTIFCLSIFFFSLTITVHASLVTEGRALLFNGGNPTYSKLLEANAKFAAAVKAVPSDQEANLFYAVTRLLAFGLEQGDGTGLATLRDLFEAFGISRNAVDIVDTGAPFNNPPLIHDHYDPPDSIPAGEDVRVFFAGPFVTLLDNAILNNLNKVGSAFTTILTTVETGDDYDIEVDYGDVLVFKSALYTLKSAILIATAYDLNIDLRELAVLGNAGVLQFQRDLLDKYPNLLNLRTADGATSLTNAKTALLAGINAYSEAFTFITDESDPQANDLFYFDSDNDQRAANFILTQLTELQSSLTANRPAVFTTIDETWIFTDENGKRIQIEIEKDVNGNFLGGHAWGLDGCDFLFCSGGVEDLTISGTDVTIEMASNWFCSPTPIYYTLTGTLQYDAGEVVTGIENGNYSWTNCEGVPKSGTFTGLLVNSEPDTETIDFNLIFGNTDKSPLDIRAILPEFDQYGEPIAGTFPGVPVLNGILPDYQTNDALTVEMELQPESVNTSSVSGTITCPAHDGTGNIFVWAYDGPDYRSAHRLGGAVVDASGNYTITGLPVGANVYIFARWDADNNGTRTFGDYIGKTGPITVASGGTSGADFEPKTIIAGSKGESYFGLCNVQALYTPSGVMTGLTVRVFDPDGTIPGTIESVTVAGPGNFSQSLTVDDFMSVYNIYWRGITGEPLGGEYTFTVTDSDGKTAVSYYYFPGASNIPLPDSSTFQTSGDSLSPTLSWGAVSGYNSNLFYRARIYDTDNNIIWTSNFTSLTSVDVPEGILVEGTDYTWHAASFDNYTYPASDNHAVGGKVPLTINNDKPYFKGAAVCNRRDSDGQFYTALKAVVVDPNGTLPGSIQSLTVKDPNGTTIYTFQSEDYDSFFQEYYKKISGQPVDGLYEFTVTDINVNTKTTYDYVRVQDVPMVDQATLQASGDSLAPTLSWGVPAEIDRSLYYRVIIENSSDGSRVWGSGRTPETYINVPSGILQSGGSYRWHVRTCDDKYWIHYSNQARSGKVNLSIDNTRPYFKYATVYKRHTPDGIYTALDAAVVDPDGTVPDSIQSLTVTGPNSFSQDLLTGDYYPPDNEFFLMIPDAPVEGVYTFTITDSNGNISVTHDYVKVSADIPLVDETGISVTGNALSPTISWSGISGYQGHLYYRLRVFDDQFNTVYKSKREPFTAQEIPEGILEGGKSYFACIEAHDHRHWVIYDSRSNSSKVIWTLSGGALTSVSGNVSDSEGSPIPNLHVYAQSEASGGNWLAGVNTDSNGNYILYGLPEGNVYIRACASCTGLTYVDEWYGGIYNSNDSTPVSVIAGHDTPGINFTLEIGGTISGHVYKEDSITPVYNVHVYACDYNTGEWVGGVNTNQDGSYTLVLPTGTYRVASCSDLNYIDEHYDNASAWDQATEVLVTSPGETSGIDFTLTSTLTRATIEEAVADGLAWLAGEQITGGSWGAEYALAKTALAVLNLEAYATSQSVSPLDTGYQYHTQVQTGLYYIFSHAYTIPIGTQPAGNPDTDGNGIGVYFTVPDESHSTYYTSIAMMAIAASNSPDSIVNVTSSPVNGWTYRQVLQNAVDYLAWGQTDSGYGRGGWNYGPTNNDNTRSDQSNSGWVTLALAYAEADPPEGFGLTIPGFVRSELEYWINYSQDDVDGDDADGGSHYSDITDPNDMGANVLRTGNLLQQMAFVGDTAAKQRVQDAVDYIVRHWDSGWHWCYHTTYTAMKGLEALGIETIDSINWFQDFSDALRSEQSIHGWWPVSSYDTGDSILSTEWAILTLQKAVAPTEENPDLVIIDKHEEWVNEGAGTYTVSYTVKNRGNIEAPAGHDVGLAIDGVDVEQQAVPVALTPGETYSDVFETVLTLNGFTDEIKVCADINVEIDELNEDNNCVTNIILPPGYTSTILNFDSVDASAGSVNAENYLASFGITLSGVTPGTVVDIINDINMYGGDAMDPSSPTNFLTQSGSNDPVTFTLNFGTPLEKVTFTRTKLIAATQSGIIHPEWSAHALDADGVEIDVVSEAQIASDSDVPANTFTLNGPGIKSIRFDSNNQHVAAFSAVLIDDLILIIPPPPVMGDLNGDTNVDLADAILALKVIVGLNPTEINLGADVNEDNKIGLAEVVYILQKVAGLR